jgi:hypothetical protein
MRLDLTPSNPALPAGLLTDESCCCGRSWSTRSRQPIQPKPKNRKGPTSVASYVGFGECLQRMEDMS